MKKTWMAIPIALALMAASSSASALTRYGAHDYAASLRLENTHGVHRVKAKSMPASKNFLYLDMVQQRKSSAIRSAVIVYEHALRKKKMCDINDAKADEQTCLRTPML